MLGVTVTKKSGEFLTCGYGEHQYFRWLSKMFDGRVTSPQNFSLEKTKLYFEVDYLPPDVENELKGWGEVEYKKLANPEAD